MFWHLHLVHIFVVLQTARAVFFHQRSHVTLAPESSSQETFGFSLAYQKGPLNLVTGAPHSSRTGKVFNCPLREALVNKTIFCKEAVIDVDALAPFNREYATNVKLNIGYSVSAADDYFFTCAPLWTEAESNHTVGTCFRYTDTASRYKTFVETRGDQLFPNQIPTGNGWRTLVDENWLLVATVASPPDVTYVDTSGALESLQSMVFNENKTDFHLENYINSFRNVGFSITSGKFFSKETVYAISALNSKTNKGVIHFMEPQLKARGGKQFTLMRSGTDYLVIKDKGSPGSMFGASMCSAMLNADQRAELVVGSPAWSDRQEGGFETGAVHIYVGGTKFHHETDVMRRHRVIVGDKDGSRFGSAVAASDLDGDHLSEIFISAPYEGDGALYILSGFEINTKFMKTEKTKKISMAQLTRTQRIQNNEFKTFGYSLHVIADIDGNGCDGIVFVDVELAVGSPKSQNIMILRCLPSVDISVEANHIGDKLKLQDESFLMRVCVNVQDVKHRSLVLPITLTNDVKGNGVYIDNNQTKIDLSVSVDAKEENNCVQVLVKLVDYEQGEYVFHTSVTMDEDMIMNTDSFDLSWALISPYSNLSSRAEVSRRCSGSDCDPNLVMQFDWHGGNITNGSYELGSSDSLKATLLVTNVGHSAWEACALVSVSGATVAQFGCFEDSGHYKCLLPTGLKRYSSYQIDIKLDMSQPKNVDEEIEIHVLLLDFCDEPKTTSEVFERLKLKFGTEEVLLTGSTEDQYISDTKILDQKGLKVIRDAHEYWVENKGNIAWMNILANVTVTKKPFIDSLQVENWTSDDFPDVTAFFHSFDLQPGAKEKIIVSIDIAKDKIMGHMKNNKLIVKSSFTLTMYPTTVIKEKSISSKIYYKQEMRFGQNKNLIVFLAVILALIAMAIIIFALYKAKFFQNEEKAKLEELKQEQINRETNEQHFSENDDLGGLEMEVEDDDSAFEIVEMTKPVIQSDSSK